ncbi:mite allergen Der f 3-like [Nasonia vitripennis]|uniref:chymotrypsin n=1 Tax=Nasonia vitripennis TaxID=7425 RepID=A0A7M7GDG8_NASVI|nr:mite allergen Der f 3-like [Nasonia vitripennis]
MLKVVLFLCGLLALSQGRLLNPRIVNGIDAKQGEIPFQVSLQRYGSHFCGGSVLNENYVVTAAHCLQGSPPDGISIVVGTLEYKKPGQTREAVKITIHERFSPANSYSNDVALIKINTPFKFNKLVQPVPLPDLHTKIATNSTAVVSGWGRLGGANGGIPDTLKKAQIWVADPDYCREVMKKQGMIIHPTQICANDPTTRRGQCNGDSGGPLIVNGKLTGIVSWSIKDPYCASTEYPGVYTRVPEFIDWILEHAV